MALKLSDLKNRKQRYQDEINHPKHYNVLDAFCKECDHPIECIDVVSAMSFNLGNAIKYIWRCDHKKDAIEDLKKAVFYLQHEIARREKKSD